MRRTLRGAGGAIAACALALLTPINATAELSISSDATRAAIDAAVQRDRASYGGRTPVPGVLVGVWDGMGNVYVRGYGYADLARRVPLTRADHFRIGSNTNTFVVTVLLQLVDEGKLKLDDPLSRFALGVSIPNAANITVRELMEMRSGLFEAYDTPEIDKMNITGSTKFEPRTLIAWAAAQKPYFAPGKRYRYTNTNYLILGLIVESLTHDTVENQIRKRLLVPFGLQNTSFPTTQAMPAPWAHGYGFDKNRNWEDVSGTIPVSLMWAAGAMISDMDDSRHWLKLYVTGKTNSSETQRARLTCISTGEGNLAFGLGIGCSAGWFGYTGGLPGYNTAAYYLPSSHVTIVAWTTVQIEKPFPGMANAIVHDIAKIVTPQHVPFSK